MTGTRNLIGGVATVNRKGERGYMLVLMLGAIAVLMISVADMFIRLQSVVHIAYTAQYQMRAFYEANAAVEDGISRLVNNPSYQTAVTGYQLPGQAPDSYDIAFKQTGNTLVITGTGHAGSISRTLNVNATLAPAPGSGAAALPAFNQEFFFGSGVSLVDALTFQGDSLFVSGNLSATGQSKIATSVVKATGTITGSGSGNGSTITGTAQPNQPPVTFPALGWKSLQTEPTNWTHVTLTGNQTISGAKNYATNTVVDVNGNLTLTNVTVTGNVAYVVTGNVTLANNVGPQNNNSTLAVLAQSTITLSSASVQALLYTPSTLSIGGSGSFKGDLVAGSLAVTPGANWTLNAGSAYSSPLTQTFAPVLQVADPSIQINSWSN